MICRPVEVQFVSDVSTIAVVFTRSFLSTSSTLYDCSNLGC